MHLPNFLIIGAARCGTTSLYAYMKEHPDIYMPAKKRPEPHFFLKHEEYEKGIEYYSRKYFSEWNGERASGEASTSYLYQSYVPERISLHIPKIKLIAILRNPVDRAYSNYWVTVQNKLESLSFEEAVKTEKKRISETMSDFWQAVQPHAYVDRGFYYNQLKRYLDFFNREQLLVLIFEDLIHSGAASIVKKVFQFLGVEDTFLPASLGMIMNKRSTPAVPMDPKIRRYLIRIFEPENDKLSQLIGRDLKMWNE